MMKTYLKTILSLTIILGLFACGGGEIAPTEVLPEPTEIMIDLLGMEIIAYASNAPICQ